MLWKEEENLVVWGYLLRISVTPPDPFTFFILMFNFFIGILIFVTTCEYAHCYIKKHMVILSIGIGFTYLVIGPTCSVLSFLRKISSTSFEGKGLYQLIGLYQLVGGVTWWYISPIIWCSRLFIKEKKKWPLLSSYFPHQKCFSIADGTLCVCGTRGICIKFSLWPEFETSNNDY